MLTNFQGVSELGKAVDMGKVSDYDLTGQSQELIDGFDEIRTLLNFGKYQPQVVASIPTWTGRQGEFVWVFGGTGGLYVCTTDNSTTWRVAATFSF